MENSTSRQRWEGEFARVGDVAYYQELSNYWWLDCYEKIEDFVKANTKLTSESVIFETGSGSGNSTLRLASEVKEVVLLDSSRNSLECSRELARHYQANNISFIEADFLDYEIGVRKYDLCWNVGVIEHFEREKAILFLQKMLAVTKEGGSLIVGVPNFRSAAMLKAKILAKIPWFKLAKGYRLHDEIEYGAEDVERMIKQACREAGVNAEVLKDFVGSYLPVETPEWLYPALMRYGKRFFRKNSFLIMFAIKNIKRNS